MPRSNLLDADARFQQHIPSRVPPPACCHACGQPRLLNHRDLADGTRVVTCLDCGQLSPRTNGGGLIKEPLKTLAVVAILGAIE